MKKILKCRCGGNGFVRNRGCRFYVECDTCHACSVSKKTLDDAIDEWNRTHMNYYKFIELNNNITIEDILNDTIKLYEKINHDIDEILYKMKKYDLKKGDRK